MTEVSGFQSSQVSREWWAVYMYDIDRIYLHIAGLWYFRIDFLFEQFIGGQAFFLGFGLQHLLRN
jgi:hypothetical protein